MKGSGRGVYKAFFSWRSTDLLLNKKKDLQKRYWSRRYKDGLFLLFYRMTILSNKKNKRKQVDGRLSEEVTDVWRKNMS